MEKNYFYANNNQKGTRVAILTLDKLDFNWKSVTRDKERHIVIKGPIHQECMTIINIHTLNNKAQNEWTNIDRIEGKNRQFYDRNLKLQYSTLSNGKSI